MLVAGRITDHFEEFDSQVATLLLNYCWGSLGKLLCHASMLLSVRLLPFLLLYCPFEQPLIFMPRLTCIEGTFSLKYLLCGVLLCG